ncbi:MAG TPA: sulfite exporter TauE/SafE family protein [Burkholderiaceae bacterium]
MHFDLQTGAAGLLVGAIVGVTGVGGGALMTPILVLLFGVAPTTAVGTDLLYASVTKAAGTAVHQSHGTVDWQVVRRLAAGSLPASALTLAWMHLSGTGHLKDGVVLVSLGLALAVTALGILFKAQIHRLGTTLRLGDGARFKAWQPGLTVACGASLGVMVTLTSVGAGALGTAMLAYLYPLRLSAGRLVGTDLAHAIPLTLVAGLGHLTLGNVDLGLMLNLLAGSLPGVVAGSLVSARAPVALVRGLIALVLLAVSCRMVFH